MLRNSANSGLRCLMQRKESLHRGEMLKQVGTGLRTFSSLAESLISITYVDVKASVVDYNPE